MGELILTRNAILDLGLGVKPGGFCLRFLETLLCGVSLDKSKVLSSSWSGTSWTSVYKKHW